MFKKFITVSEDTIIKAMRIVHENLEMIIEPSSAVVLGGLLEKPEPFKGQKIGMILTGGNADLNNLPW